MILSTFIDFFKSFQVSGSDYAPLTHDPEATIVISHCNEDYFNSIYLKAPHDYTRTLEELIHFQEKLNKPLTVWMTPQTHAPGFDSILKQTFASPGDFLGMVLDLHQLNLASNSVAIEQVQTTIQARAYAEIFCEIFHVPSLMQSIEKWVLSTTRHYVAKFNDHYVGASSLMLNKKYQSAGLYNACVLPAFRNLGIGSAMAQHRIAVAKSLDMRSVSIVLMADAMAKRYCDKLGFKAHGTLTPYFIKFDTR